MCGNCFKARKEFCSRVDCVEIRGNVYTRTERRRSSAMQLIYRVWLRLLRAWWHVTVPPRLRSHGIKLGVGCRFYGMPIVAVEKNSRIILGDRVVLCSDSRFTALGVNHPVVLRTLRPHAEIFIDDDSAMSGGSICAAVRVHLGKQCLIGANVTIADTDFHS